MESSELSDFQDHLYPDPRPAWTRVWHVWRIIIPRRSIDGGMVWGSVWRRHDGRHWIYKRLTGFDDQAD